MKHIYHFRICYVDTDAGGIVYHSNYLDIAERARTDFLFAIGYSNKILLEKGVGIIIRRAEIDYKAPARLEDMLDVETTVSTIKGASIIMHQTVKCGNQVLVVMKMHAVFVDKDIHPTRLPSDIRIKFEQYVEEK